MERGGDVFGGSDLVGVALLPNSIDDAPLDLHEVVLHSPEQRKLLHSVTFI